MDSKSFDFISNWYDDNHIVVERVPEVLSEYAFEWSDNTMLGGTVYYEAKWLNDTEVDFKVRIVRSDGIVRAKLHFTSHYDYAFVTRLKAIERLANGGVDVASVKPPLQAVPFPVGVASATDEPLDDGDTELARLFAYIHIYVMYFMANYHQELTEYVDKQIEKKPAKKKKKKGKSTKPKTVMTTVIRVNKYVRDVQTGEKKLPRHNKKCQYAYGVKGHYRHYKSGKVVWIAPHQRNTLEQRKKRSKQYRFDLKVSDK